VWSIATDGGLPELRLRWVESNGLLVVAPAKRGFGSILIERSLRHALGGNARLDFAPSGVICEIRLPLARQEKGAYSVKLTENSL
jgi:two-component sensor histidine kinase